MDVRVNMPSLRRILRDGPDLADMLDRKAAAGAAFWTANSIKRTGYNASSVVVGDGRAASGAMKRTIYAHGYYAKWREIGTRYHRPEAVLRRSVPTIAATP